MEEYKKVLKKREKLCLIFAIILLPVVIATCYLFFVMDSVLTGSIIAGFFGGMLNGIRAGFGLAALIVLSMRAFQYHKAVKDDNKMKKYYIEEYDERTIALNQLSSKISFNIILYTLLVVCVITGFINSTISLTLLAVSAFIILCKAIIYTIYSKKI
ncbi:hypothetical protein SH1V18_43820 [Vallitalea longa]|uniref:Uncharacterized protein n=1 Tax=Vallitalea longa TaxID=2936439 RepID=A0A9W5YE86_9FIRM|nr:hypothetical protein [Vallitalea longa]GKX31902.1 hypothetical protein SH1V18_43820 [Vallitalea longa]